MFIDGKLFSQQLPDRKNTLNYTRESAEDPFLPRKVHFHSLISPFVPTTACRSLYLLPFPSLPFPSPLSGEPAPLPFPHKLHCHLSSPPFDAIPVPRPTSRNSNPNPSPRHSSYHQRGIAIRTPMDENKKIDFDAPLLSIRRFSVEPPTSSSSTTSVSNSTNQAHRRSSLPFYKPDIKSGPVTNPGVIPFVWEQRPGQPKPGANSPSRPPFVAPRPPPVKSGSSVRTRKPVTNYLSSVKETKDPCFEDFRYTNGERLEEKQGQIMQEEKLDKPPKVVVESVRTKSRRDISNGNHESQELVKPKQEEKQENKEIKKEEHKQTETEMQEEDEEEEEDNFSDALDTLSRTESFFMNCSVSGLSELPVGPTKQSTLPGGSDNDAREFMIGRFLPAAQAVATGSPQYTFRKAPGPGRELAKPTQPIVGVGFNPDQRRVPVPLPFQHQPKYENNYEEDEEDDEEEDDEEDFEESRRFSAKGCGFLPSFCMKSSFLMMNPVPGMKGRGKAVPSRGGAGRRTGSLLIRSSNDRPDSKRSDSFENYMVS